MANATVAELTLAEECESAATDAGFSKRELAGLKRILAKRTDGEIFAAISKLCGGSATDSEQAIGMLYSLTDTQIVGLEAALKNIQGWD